MTDATIIRIVDAVGTVVIALGFLYFLYRMVRG
jgi:hypothetical protein